VTEDATYKNDRGGKGEDPVGVSRRKCDFFDHMKFRILAKLCTVCWGDFYGTRRVLGALLFKKNCFPVPSFGRKGGLLRPRLLFQWKTILADVPNFCNIE